MHLFHLSLPKRKILTGLAICGLLPVFSSAQHAKAHPAAPANKSTTRNAMTTLNQPSRAVLSIPMPGNVSDDIALWLDASDPNANGTLPADGAPIGTWKDKSGSNNDAVLISGQTVATYSAGQINGKSTLNFARSDDSHGSFYSVNNLDIRSATNPDITIFSVYRPGQHGPSDFMGVWGADNGDWDRFFLCTWGQGENGAASFGPGNPTAADVVGSGVVGQTRLLTAVYDGDVSDGANNGPVNGSAMYFNGRLITTFTDHTHPTDAQTSFRIGFDGDNSAYNGDIAEMIVYTRRLSYCEILAVNKYLANKYGQDFSVADISLSSGSNTICPNTTVSLTTSAFASYQWLKDDVAIDGATAAAYEASDAGSYRVIVNTGEGCKDTSSATTLVKSNLSANITADKALEFCPGDFVNLTAPAGYDYEWYADGAYFYQTGQTINVTNSGTYTVKVTDIASGCSATTSTDDAVKVTVHPYPDPSIYPQGQTSFCAGGQVELKAATGLSSYEWFRDDVKIDGAGNAPYIAKQSGSYSLHVVTDKGCIGTAVANSELSTEITAHPLPVASITADGPLHCAGQATLTATPDMVSYAWTYNGSALTNSTNSLSTANGGSYALTVTDNNSCSGTTAAAYILKLDPNEDCDGDGISNATECPLGYNCSDKDADGIPDYLDTDSDGDGRTDAEEGTGDCNKNGIADYLDADPCTTAILMPTLFSPNGDGKNDIIKPVAPGLKSFNYIRIFNRWGNIVFESKDQSQGWDGRLKGKEQPQDTYIWVASGTDKDGKTVTYKGMFSLIR